MERSTLQWLRIVGSMMLLSGTGCSSSDGLASGAGPSTTDAGDTGSVDAPARTEASTDVSSEPNVGTDTGPTPADARAEVMDGEPPDQSPDVKPVPKRVVVERNPFGNTADIDNLFIDGDFELSIGAITPTWLVVDSKANTAVPFLYRSGGLCRSGLTCVEVGADEYLYGRVEIPLASVLRFSFYAKPADGNSERVEGYLWLRARVGTQLQPYETVPIPVSSIEPDAEGWFRYEAAVVIEKQYDYAAMVVFGIGQTLVDDLVAVRADTPSNAPKPYAASLPHARLTASQLRMVERTTRQHQQDKTPELVRRIRRPDLVRIPTQVR